MDKKIIPVTCNGARTMPMEALENFQGNLKTIDNKAFEKLRRLILKRGFSFPVFVWDDKKIMDGHQRLFVTGWLIKHEGYALNGDIPVCDIDAGTESEAAEKLLELQGRFGKITEVGLYDFIETYDIDFAALVDDIDLPDIDVDAVLAETGHNPAAPGNKNKNGEDGNGSVGALKYQVLIDCKSESHQKQLLEKLNQEGEKCRPLML